MTDLSDLQPGDRIRITIEGEYDVTAAAALPYMTTVHHDEISLRSVLSVERVRPEWADRQNAICVDAEGTAWWFNDGLKRYWYRVGFDCSSGAGVRFDALRSPRLVYDPQAGK